MSPKIPEVDSSVSGGGTKKLMRAASLPEPFFRDTMGLGVLGGDCSRWLLAVLVRSLLMLVMEISRATGGGGGGDGSPAPELGGGGGSPGAPGAGGGGIPGAPDGGGGASAAASPGEPGGPTGLATR